MDKENKKSLSRDNKKSHSRAHGMTQISISLPQRLVDKIDQLAELEKRSRSNYIAYIVDIMPDVKANNISLLHSEPKEIKA